MKTDMQNADMSALKERAGSILNSIETLLALSKISEGDGAGDTLLLDKRQGKEKTNGTKNRAILLAEMQIDIEQLKVDMTAAKKAVTETSTAASAATKSAQQAQGTAVQALATANHALDEAQRAAARMPHLGRADSPALNRPPGWSRE